MTTHTMVRSYAYKAVSHHIDFGAGSDGQSQLCDGKVSWYDDYSDFLKCSCGFTGQVPAGGPGPDGI